MAIVKNVNNVIVETPISDGDRFIRTGVIREDSFAVCDEIDPIKQIQFNASPLTTNSRLILQAPAASGDIVITFPSTSGTLSFAGATNSFAIIQCDAGTSPTADSDTDTLTLTSSDGSVVITGNSTTDTVTLTVDATSANTASKIVKRDASGNFVAGSITAEIIDRVVSVSSTHTIASIDQYTTYLLDSTSAAFTVNLPSAATVGAGRKYRLKDSAGKAGTNVITIDGSGSETIDGQTTYKLNENYESVTIVSNGTNWFAV